MPEGPEIRTVADKLRPILVSRIITSSYKGERAKTIGFDNLKCPTTIIGVRSHGKKLLIDLDSGHMIIVSLGMSGRLQYTPGNHSHVRFDISESQINGPFKVIKPVCSVYFDDSRYMGGVDIIPNASIVFYFKDIGPDLLQLSLDEKTWMPLQTWITIFTAKKLQKRAICEVLMDQSLVSGIGNYVKAEVLYYSGVHPERTVETITIEEWDRLRISAHKVLRLSYSCFGFTIESFISPDGQLGTYPSAVYGKTHDPNGNPVVKSTTKDGRTTHWVPSLQH